MPTSERPRKRKPTRKSKPAEEPAEETGPPPDTVTLWGEPIKLRPPNDYAIKLEVVGAWQRHYLRGPAACLAVCLPYLRRPQVDHGEHGHDPLVYGGVYLHKLIESGLTAPQIIDAGKVAYRLLNRGLVRAFEVKEAEGNSSPPEDSPG